MSFLKFQINGMSLARPGLQCWEGKCLSLEIFAFLCLFFRLGGDFYTGCNWGHCQQWQDGSQFEEDILHTHKASEMCIPDCSTPC